jgi:hypothetical protein
MMFDVKIKKGKEISSLEIKASNTCSVCEVIENDYPDWEIIYLNKRI